MAVKTGNPALYLPTADEITRVARRGILAEFDMLTFDGSNPALMLDQSGNGYNALFNSTPTKTSEGVSFNGTYWADVTLPVLPYNYAQVLIFKTGANGFYLAGSRNTTDQSGASLRAFTPSNFVQLEGNVASNQAQCTGISSANYYAVIGKIARNRQGRLKKLGSGVLGYTNFWRGTESGSDDRTLWRIGSGIQTVSGDHTVSLSPLPSGTIAYYMVYQTYTSENQDRAILNYLKAKMTARGITLS